MAYNFLRAGDCDEGQHEGCHHRAHSEEPSSAAALPHSQMAAATDELLHGVSGHSLSDLAAEAPRLLREEAQVQEKIRALVLSSYRVHIESVDSGSNVTRLLEGLRRSCEAGLEATERASAAVDDNLWKSLDACMALERRVQKTLAKEREVIDLVELPAMVDACQRNGNFPEVLNACELANSLAARFHPGDASYPLVAAIVVSVRQVRDKALVSIQEALSEARLGVTAAFDSMQLLRRILRQRARERRRGLPVDESGVSEDFVVEQSAAELLLSCRQAVLRSATDQVASLQPLARLSRRMDLFRQAWTEVPSLFVTLCVQPLMVEATSSSPPDAVLLASLTTALSVWVRETSDMAISLVSSDVSELSLGSDTAQAHEVILTAFARAAALGADQTYRAEELLCESARVRVTNALHKAAESFAAESQRGSWAYVSAIIGSSSVRDETPASDDGVPTPPSSLLGLAPLARACNAVIAVLDDLRRCADVVGRGFAIEALSQFVRTIARHHAAAIDDQVVQELAQAESYPPEDADAALEREAAMTAAILDEFAPFVRRATGHALQCEMLS
jgi:hypothetical protein